MKPICARFRDGFLVRDQVAEGITTVQAYALVPLPAFG